MTKGVTVKIIKEGIGTSYSIYKMLLAIFRAVYEMDRETKQKKTQQKINKLKEDKRQ
ncbi:recombinase family protein [Clostridioides sp. ZZV14-6045]|nr:recombinase family protein [Clostridioides sp. ZZV14-6045]MCC0740790.1 recombinase family protein [Clostridioides sp. ZZV14-5902]